MGSSRNKLVFVENLGLEFQAWARLCCCCEKRIKAWDHSPIWSLHYPSGEGSSWAKENAAEKKSMSIHPEASQEARVWGLGFPTLPDAPREGRMPGFALKGPRRLDNAQVTPSCFG